ncbi:MAG: YigZ family protein [Clostridia bacterium]|nr:YigZ family protein [Clostridia bacterium]MBQ8029894.1 YigZ family protein [Clostridia bacterium]
MSEYKTIKNENSDEFVVKKSRFIGYVKPVTTQQEAVDFINEIKSKHWDATHNVYAYVLREGQIRRYSDDGEPQGTAGIPVLDVLLKEGVTDCVVVATRYFGGIMLGAGGLVRAYSHTAKIAVDSGKIITMSLCKIAAVSCDYTYYGRLTPLICQFGGIVEDTEFSDSVKVVFRIPENDFERLNAQIFDSSNGKYKAEAFDEKYCEI